MTTKLQGKDSVWSTLLTVSAELTPERVKQLMEDVIREHLGWLIVWGNVFGGVIGIIAKAVQLWIFPI